MTIFYLQPTSDAVSVHLLRVDALSVGLWKYVPPTLILILILILILTLTLTRTQPPYQLCTRYAPAPSVPAIPALQPIESAHRVIDCPGMVSILKIVIKP